MECILLFMAKLSECLSTKLRSVRACASVDAGIEHEGMFGWFAAVCLCFHEGKMVCLLLYFGQSLRSTTVLSFG